MVSFTNFEGDNLFANQNANQEHSKFHDSSIEGFEVPAYILCTSMKGDDAYDEFSCTIDNDQSLLDTLILSQWEARACKGGLSYDVTSCETKIIGRRKLTVQLNEGWNSNFLNEFEKRAFQLSDGLIKPIYIKNNQENIIFCVVSGDREKSMLIPLLGVPPDGILIIVNENPVEYGHIFLVPYCMNQRVLPFARGLQLMTQIADEVDNFSFRLFYDDFSAINMDLSYFQASYFANPLPVELLPAILIHRNSLIDGIEIHELEDYPLKTLVFTGKNMKKLADVVGEICSIMKSLNTVFNLLISGTKMFLFPQVRFPITGRHLHTWECGGYFIYDKSLDFISASETKILNSLASVSLDNEQFQGLKQVCCGIAAKMSESIRTPA